MYIKDINLDLLDRQEYLHFINCILEYYYVQFQELLEIKKGEIK